MTSSSGKSTSPAALEPPQERTVEEDEEFRRAEAAARDHRLSMPFSIRLVSGTTIACVTGMSLGLSYGAKTAALRFRAENAHRQPKTSTGWYLYHKSKNYNIMYGGVVEGVNMAGRCGWWVASFFTAEEAVDRLRGTRDFGSTVVASLGTAGLFSLWSAFLLSFIIFHVTNLRTVLDVDLGYMNQIDSLFRQLPGQPRWASHSVSSSAWPKMPWDYFEVSESPTLASCVSELVDGNFKSSTPEKTDP